MNWTWTCNLVYWWAQALLVFEIKINVQSLTFNTWLNLVCLQYANHFNSYSIWVGKNKNAFKFLVVDFVVLIISVEPSLYIWNFAWLFHVSGYCLWAWRSHFRVQFSSRECIWWVFFFLNFILSCARCLYLLCKCKCNFV